MEAERDEFLERLNKSGDDMEEVIGMVMTGEMSFKEANARMDACAATLKQLNVELKARNHGQKSRRKRYGNCGEGNSVGPVAGSNLKLWRAAAEENTQLCAYFLPIQGKCSHRMASPARKIYGTNGQERIFSYLLSRGRRFERLTRDSRPERRT